MAYLELYISFFKIGLFCIGGGYAALPLIKNEIVDANAWLSIGEFVDVITVAEMTPGPIALNAATFVGIKCAGVFGAVAATLGFVTAPVIIVTVLAQLYFKYKELGMVKGILATLRPAVVGLISAAALAIIILAVWGESGVSFDINSINFVGLGIMAAGFLVLRKFKISPVSVMLASGAIGSVIYLMMEGFL